MSSRYKTIVDKLLEIFKEDQDLKRTVKQFRTAPPLRNIMYPTLWVEWGGGPVLNIGSEEEYPHKYHVVTISRGTDTEKAEAEAMWLTELIEAAVEADHTLGSTVSIATVTNQMPDRQVDGDALMVGVRTTIETTYEEA